MDFIYKFLSQNFVPFTSPLFLLSFIILISLLNKYKTKKLYGVIYLSLFIFFSYVTYITMLDLIDLNKWLIRLNSPIILVITVIVIPAIFLKRDKWYKYFLLLPFSLIVLAIFEMIFQYSKIPDPKSFVWFLMSPSFLISMIISFLVIVQYFTPLDLFRKITRLTMLIVLVYGGFLFRQNYIDYNEMIDKRVTQKRDIISFAETVPVMKYDNKLTYVPSAPCRFSSDGGYVQGCVMELLQRIMQTDFKKIIKGNKEETALLAIALSAFVTLLVLLFIGARWWCGWICPLSCLGDIFDLTRRFFRFPHFKLFKKIKKTYFYSGISLGTFGLLLAQAYARVDENGMFMGCKIPLYPFCKICPGQQVCPVAAKGTDGYPPIPGFEWLFGFFKMFSLILLAVFIISFISARSLWCYFCPMGLIGGIFNKNSLLSIKKDSTKCNLCGTCNEVCPMDIHKVQKEMIKEDVTSFDCVYCLRCVDKCPKDKCLSFQFANKKIIESKF